MREGVACYIGNGVVVDPTHLLLEIERLEAAGVEVRSRLFISESCPLILDYHVALDRAREKAKKIGTTGRGIGPAYEDKVGRRAIRVQDLKNPSTLGPKVDRILVHHNALRRGRQHDAVADVRAHVGPQDARGDQAQHRLLVADDQRVPRIVAALEANDSLGVQGEPEIGRAHV